MTLSTPSNRCSDHHHSFGLKCSMSTSSSNEMTGNNATTTTAYGKHQLRQRLSSPLPLPSPCAGVAPSYADTLPSASIAIKPRAKEFLLQEERAETGDEEREPNIMISNSFSSEDESCASSESSSSVPRGGKAGASSLMDFVSHMSLDDYEHSAAASAVRMSSEEDDTDDVEEEKTDIVPDDPHHLRSFSFASCSELQASSSHDNNSNAWLPVSTPETTKYTISTPQALRLSYHKRKTPLQPPSHLTSHQTPVDSRLLALPSLNSTESLNSLSTSGTNARTFTSNRALTFNNSCNHYASLQHSSSYKKARGNATLLNGAPMLPSSPDLETNMRSCHQATTRAAPTLMPYFSPVNGFNMANPMLFERRFPSKSPSPQAPRRTTRMAAGLPSLDEIEQSTSGSKWIRMRKRNSLLTALRLGVSDI